MPKKKRIVWPDWVDSHIEDIGDRIAAREKGQSWRKLAKYLAEYNFNVAHNTVYERYKHLKKLKNETVPELRTLRRKIKEKDLASQMMDITGEVKEEIRPRPQLTPAQLIEFRDGVKGFVKFCRKVLYWQGKPVKIQKFQKEMAKKVLKEKRNVFVLGRGAGKDFFISCFVVWSMVCFANTRLLIVSPAQRQSNQLLEKIKAFFKTSEILKGCLIKETEDELGVTNGSVTYALPATGQIAGYHNIHTVIINEARNVKDEVYNIVSPMLGTIEGAGSLVLVSSAAPLPMGFLWRCYNHPEFAKGLVHHPTWVNKHYDKSHLEREKKIMSNNSYMIEYGAKFGSGLDAFFNYKLIEAAIMDYDYNENKEPNKTYYCGVDWGRVRDYSVIITESRTKDGEYKIESIKVFDDKPFYIQKPYIKYLDSKLRYRKMIVEYAGIGIPPAEELRRDFPSKVRYFKPTVEHWIDAYDLLKRDFEQKLITIPAGELRLINQLKMLQFQVLPISERVAVKIGDKGANDFVSALAFSHWGAGRKGGGMGIAYLET